MKILSLDQGARTAILESDRDELAKLLGFRSWWDLDRTGKTPKTGFVIDVALIVEAAKMIREEKVRLRGLRDEYRKRIEELDRLIALADDRPTPAEEPEGGTGE